MAPDEVAKADTAKLHAEINNYVNHQYIIYASGLTIVGVILAWVTQKTNPTDASSLDVAYVGASLILVFLTLLNLLDLRLEVARHICASYLRSSGASEWERQIERYARVSKSKQWLAVTSRHSYYVLLGLLAASWPAALAVIEFKATRVTAVSGLHASVSIVYLAFATWGMPRVLKSARAEVEAAWNKMLANRVSEPPDDD
ncbi:MAG: hypothetical protein JO013_04385 [Alphaproteobacteria bacterium]|nr:hypothetical protein [Alphaproteobacteria bacterium]